MSKSLGNIINPLDMIEKYGTDATRLSLLIGGTPGNDMKLSEEKIAGFRNFTNKLWNISRFILMNIENPKKDVERPEPKTLADKFILRELDRVVSDSHKNMESFTDNTFWSYDGNLVEVSFVSDTPLEVIVTPPTGERFEPTNNGEYFAGKKNGQGTLYFSDGSWYYGDFYLNDIQGYGTY